MWQPGVVVITTVEYSSTDGDASLWSCIALSKYFSSFTLALHSYLCYIVEPIILLYFICLKAASIASAKSFVSSFYDVYLSISASLEIICRITLTTLIFMSFSVSDHEYSPESFLIIVVPAWFLNTFLNFTALLRVPNIFIWPPYEKWCWVNQWHWRSFLTDSDIFRYIFRNKLIYKNASFLYYQSGRVA